MNLFCAGSELNIELKTFEYFTYEGDEHPIIEMSINFNDGLIDFYYDRGVHVDWVWQMISEINKTLNGVYSKEHTVEFQQYQIIGTHYDSNLKVVVHGHKDHSNDYWELKFFSAGSKNHSGQAEISIYLNLEDITFLRDDLYKKVKALELNDVGKAHYYILDIPADDFEYCYSAKELNSILSELGEGKTLREALLPMESLVLSHDEGIEYLYLWSGGSILLSFGNIAIELAIHAAGMFAYRIIENFDKIKMLSVYKRFGNEENGYYDAQLKFKTKFKGEKVDSIKVTSTEDFPFSQSGFDEEIACRTKSLPKSIKINFKNNNYLELNGDEIEYFSMKAGTQVK